MLMEPLSPYSRVKFSALEKFVRTLLENEIRERREAIMHEKDRDRKEAKSND